MQNLYGEIAGWPRQQTTRKALLQYTGRWVTTMVNLWAVLLKLFNELVFDIDVMSIRFSILWVIDSDCSFMLDFQDFLYEF